MWNDPVVFSKCNNASSAPPWPGSPTEEKTTSESSIVSAGKKKTMIREQRTGVSGVRNSMVHGGEKNSLQILYVICEYIYVDWNFQSERPPEYRNCATTRGDYKYGVISRNR